MARFLYAASPADYVVAASGAPVAGATVTIYNALSGGSQVTDLQNMAGGAISTVTTDSAGGFRFYGPDAESGTLFATTGRTRFAVNPAYLAERMVTAEADIVTAQAAIDDVPADVAASLSSLDARMDTAESDITALETKITNKITVAASAPGSPTTGDIWIDTST